VGHVELFETMDGTAPPGEVVGGGTAHPADPDDDGVVALGHAALPTGSSPRESLRASHPEMAVDEKVGHLPSIHKD
jgi:hypothetical protein